MATTVIIAFNEFMQDKVNLKKSSTDDARGSRGWLIDKMNGFENDDASPVNYPAIHIGFGSFARRTKIRPLDDIDFMFGLSAEGCTHTILYDKIVLNAKEGTCRLKNFKHADSETISSIRILNHFKTKLNDIPQYESAVITRKQEAVTLKLSSKTWNFDIVPCFKSKEDDFGNYYYLIPDGKGNWKKTHPVIDKDRTTSVNVQNGGNVLNVIRVVKYWQGKKAIPRISSYLLETMILRYYESKDDCSQFVDMELEGLFKYLGLNIQFSVQDHKGIQGDINHLSYDERNKVSAKFYSEAEQISIARNFETDKEHEKSINKWRNIFGDEFPRFG